MPPFLILTNLLTLVLELRRTAPATRWAVYEISASVAGVFYGAVLLLLNIAWQEIRRQWQMNSEIIDLIGGDATRTTEDKIIEILRTLSNSLHTTAETLDTGFEEIRA